VRRLTTFLTGVIVGGALVYGAMHYHVIRAEDGFHFVPKVDARLAGTYADIRGFQVGDWTEHAQIAAALVKADRRDLLNQAVGDTLSDGLDQILNRENP